MIAALVGLAVMATVAVWALWPFGNRPGGGPGGGSGTLTGHSDLVFGVAFGPDGRTVATGSRDTTVRLWDVATRRQIGEPLTGHGHQVNSVAFIPDGRLLASGSSDDEVRIWEVASHQLVGPSILHHNDSRAHWIEAVAFSPDGTRLATGGGPEGDIHVWDVVTRRPVGGLFGHTGHIGSLVYSPDGRLVAAGSSTPDHAARVWDNDTGRLVDTPDLGPSRLAFSPNGRILAASRGNSTQLWDVATWRPLGTPMVRTRTTREPTKGDYLAFSPDGRLLATAGTVHDAVWLWDPGSRQPVCKPLTTDCAGPLAFSPDSRTLAVACGNDVRLVESPSTRAGDHEAARHPERQVVRAARRPYQSGTAEQRCRLRHHNGRLHPGTAARRGTSCVRCVGAASWLDAVRRGVVCRHDELIQRLTSEPPTLTVEQVRAAFVGVADRDDVAGFLVCDPVSGERWGNVAVEHHDGIGHVSYWRACRHVVGALPPARFACSPAGYSRRCR